MRERSAAAGPLTAALELAARRTPFGAVSTGPVPGQGFRPVRSLHDDDAVLAGLVDRVRRRVGAVEPRVAVSLLFQGWAARLWSVELGVLLHAGRLPDLSPDLLLWRDDEGSLRLHLEHPVALPGPPSAGRLGEQVVDRYLRPLLAALRRLGPLSERSCGAMPPRRWPLRPGSSTRARRERRAPPPTCC